MSGQGDFDENASKRTAAPYSSHHPVPTVQDYRERQQERRDKEDQHAEITPESPQPETKIDTVKRHLHINGPSPNDIPYKSENRNVHPPETKGDSNGPNTTAQGVDHDGSPKSKGDPSRSNITDQGGNPNIKDASQNIANELDPRKKRKNMKRMKRDKAGREVTDPVTHLPVVIHDFTDTELKNVQQNMSPAGSELKTSSGVDAATKCESQLDREQDELQAEHRGLERTVFPPPDFQAAREDLAKAYNVAIAVGLGAVLSIMLATLLGYHVFVRGQLSTERRTLFVLVLLVICLSVSGAAIRGVQSWLAKQVKDILEDEIWDAAKAQEQEQSESPTPESVQWLNSLLSSVWPLINPDLFTSLADTLEDVMQASLPKLVRMISVEDLAQGSEAIRIMGVRWLPTGAAAMDVSLDGKVKHGGKGEESDRRVPGEGNVDEDANSNTSDDSKPEKTEGGAGDEDIAEGMEAEDGDFVNVEIAFSYRVSKVGKGLKNKAKNAHIYLAFYLPGGVRFPVWVELRGIVGIMRLRLQLCPDPPFFALCTMTLLGQPKADLSCVPLTKKGLNIMDLPIISSFVQSSIDAALSEYVAPKSLTLDLKDMLVGDDFKKDTTARGVVVVRIKSAKEFKEGDSTIPLIKEGSSDPYVTVGWSKFGKPVWSTRVIIQDMEPVWEETCFVLVGPPELNAEERLRVQLWDSDRTTADDDLGKVEVDLKELMYDRRSAGKMWDRRDGLMATDSDEKMPGSLEWSVGYFAKSTIQDYQLNSQTVDPSVRNIQQLKAKVSRETERKLRESKLKNRDEVNEIEQQKAQDLKNREDSMIISCPPPNDLPTGIFSIQIHQITGLEFEKTQKGRDEDSDGEEGSGDLPSSYCTIILNHQKIFKTRTKPKNAKPFFNAGTERLIRDWRNTEIILSVRDARIHENDALLGIVYLPLGHLFRKRSQINDTFPLVGGIGFGRARISMIFRSIELQVPKTLLGWDYGTLEITGPITSDDIASDLRGLRLKLRTSVQRVRVYDSGHEASWTGKHDRLVRLAVRKRYSSCLVFEFRKNSITFDKTAAFAVFWLKDIPDDEETTITLAVWKGHSDLNRAESCCLEVMGEKVGTIKVPMKLCHGLSGYHHKLAKQNPNLQDVFDALNTAKDNKEINMMAEENDSSSSSGGEGSDNEEQEHLKQSGKRGPLDQIREYKDHSGQLHRQHRGVMQWKAARTADWIKTKGQHARDRVLDNLKHHERDAGVETEV